ncbi:Cbb3-type cytochrome c oxidase subunit CcoP [Rhodobacteraceae bacterium THAF1]|uniref:cytochrome-c oxidase, cbb3-type subunit III n=1 Tax=Palleronia sp. THAF1 TaxID=2587842 RepID=UPI000F3F9B18|nr:cytochrome-c oxidase, cbb3-type subunit III [Palleronia sp. THAF1]QFU08804.1 Cbb3-type cytochrome c oxidase subunit CcoP [Palleronia sp. THAF1]VDC23939.1 Cbb3-type cytochrome c oxidase subunit CcoP [Rhodobacteraceae bacterium THAF1]
MSKRRIDPVTGTETTGHQWDGIEELNNPLPRWWLWTFYATCVFALIYVILYPAIPLVRDATGGALGWSTRGDVAAEIAEVDASQADMRESLVSIDLAALDENEALLSFATNAGGAVFRTNCSQCHGSGAAGAIGYPNLLDDEWLWGGTIEDIAYTVRHGIRNENDPDARWSQMPGFAEILEKEEIATLVVHVQSLPEGQDPLAGAGGQLFDENCSSCHGMDAGGDRSLGAPNLTDAIWLYGNSTERLTQLIERGPFGVMPPWSERLSEAEVRAVAAYVHGLGGGEAQVGEPADDTAAGNPNDLMLGDETPE